MYIFFIFICIHTVDHKPYKTINKLNTCHYNLNGDLSCIFVWFGKTQTKT